MERRRFVFKIPKRRRFGRVVTGCKSTGCKRSTTLIFMHQTPNKALNETTPTETTAPKFENILVILCGATSLW